MPGCTGIRRLSFPSLKAPGPLGSAPWLTTTQTGPNFCQCYLTFRWLPASLLWLAPTPFRPASTTLTSVGGCFQYGIYKMAVPGVNLCFNLRKHNKTRFSISGEQSRYIILATAEGENVFSKYASMHEQSMLFVKYTPHMRLLILGSPYVNI